MKYSEVSKYIVNWLKDYAQNSKTNGFVIGISGGIDSALTSTLCALTGEKTTVLNLPIRQNQSEFDRGNEHIAWLMKNFKNVNTETVELTSVLEAYEKSLPNSIQDFLTMANTRARVRMTTLYAFASHHKLLVAGTGNKVEDFGIGFFTKYGDGGVDISPIADLYKTQVYAMAKELGIVNSILVAPPTDGLFADGRSDEDQIGATYAELEWAMEYIEKKMNYPLNDKQNKIMEIYLNRNRTNLHKMNPIPVCLIPEHLK
ncbi:MAG: NAD(+) synthase [Sphingobacteriaceae bacterium]|nr:NAD(+) synthase [Sphingobacteriaceae bacterium]